jgi:hypothetical protein
MRSRITIALAPLLLLCGCDWGHSMQFQIRPRPDDLEVAEALRSSASTLRFVPPDRYADADKLFADRMFEPFFLGAFIDGDADPTPRPPWFGAWAQGDVAVVELSEFNRGSPWRPSARYERAERTLTAVLRERFGHRVRVVKKPADRIDVPWPRSPP